MHPGVSTTASALLKGIRRIPGNKIVSITMPDGSVSAFDVMASGAVGCALGHQQLFLMELTRMLDTGGGLLIRRFLPLARVPVTFENGTQGSLPWKELVSLFIGRGHYFGCSAEETEAASSVHSETGQPLKPEPYIVFKDAADYFPHPPAKPPSL